MIQFSGIACHSLPGQHREGTDELIETGASTPIEGASFLSVHIHYNPVMDSSGSKVPGNQAKNWGQFFSPPRCCFSVVRDVRAGGCLGGNRTGDGNAFDKIGKVPDA